MNLARRTVLCLLLTASAFAQQPPWTEKAAWDWYGKEPWLVGSNYIPATAINQLEMWQPETFDPTRIDLELGWAQKIGMNTMRVFLHDLLWQQDPTAFQKRVDLFLRIAAKHNIKPMFVIFDSCWDPFPKLGKQHAPRRGVHNSGWVQSPGVKALQDTKEYPRLESYVKGIVGAFARDNRILAWDVWNEPDNPNGSSYGSLEPANKQQAVLALLPLAYAWARSVHPIQPLTSGVWRGDWSDNSKFNAIQKIQMENADVVSFHSYTVPKEFEQRVKWLQRYRRPLFCTEFMARGVGSTFQGTLPIAKQYKIAAINWGLVAGSTQTYLPWDSWKKPYADHEPAIWFHEVFRKDGAPYRPEEVELIRRLTGK